MTISTKRAQAYRYGLHLAKLDAWAFYNLPWAESRAIQLRHLYRNLNNRALKAYKRELGRRIGVKF